MEIIKKLMNTLEGCHAALKAYGEYPVIDEGVKSVLSEAKGYLLDTWHYEIGQRIRRDKRHGKIINRYNMASKLCGYYPELYTIEFDDGQVESGFLWHGLNEYGGS